MKTLTAADRQMIADALDTHAHSLAIWIGERDNDVARALQLAHHFRTDEPYRCCPEGEEIHA